MIKDRMTLGVVAGFAGTIAKTVVDEISLRQNISQRSYRSTAAGVWVNKKSEATNIKGQILGAVFDTGMSMLDGIYIVGMLSRRGRDHLVVKGVVTGVTIGAMITSLLSVFPQNKVSPKDAASNLSYLVSHAAYGVVTTFVAAKLGDEALFDSEPVNNYLPPTKTTTDENSLGTE